VSDPPDPHLFFRTTLSAERMPDVSEEELIIGAFRLMRQNLAASTAAKEGKLRGDSPKDKSPESKSPRLNRPMFAFARTVRSHPLLGRLDKYEASEKVIETLTKHFRELTRSCKDKNQAWSLLFAAFKCDDPQSEFIAAWSKVRVPIGEGAVPTALAEAERSPFYPARDCGRKYSYFVSIAVHLQLSRPGVTVCLPVSKIAAMLGVDGQTVSRYRQFAEEEGILEMFAPHEYSARKATEFFVKTDLFDLKSGKQIRFVNRGKVNQSSQTQQSRQTDQD